MATETGCCYIRAVFPALGKWEQENQKSKVTVCLRCPELHWEIEARLVCRKPCSKQTNERMNLLVFAWWVLRHKLSWGAVDEFSSVLFFGYVLRLACFHTYFVNTVLWSGLVPVSACMAFYRVSRSGPILHPCLAQKGYVRN